MYKLTGQGKASDGRDIFTLVNTDDQSVKKVSRDQLVFLVGKDEVEGPNGMLSGQLYQGKVIVRGIGRGGSEESMVAEAPKVPIQAITTKVDPKVEPTVQSDKESAQEISIIFTEAMGPVDSKLFVRHTGKKGSDYDSYVAYSYLHKDNDFVQIGIKKNSDGSYSAKANCGNKKREVSQKSRQEVVSFLKDTVKEMCKRERYISVQENPIKVYKELTKGVKKIVAGIQHGNESNKSQAISAVGALTIINDEVVSSLTIDRGLDASKLSSCEWELEEDEESDVRIRLDVALKSNRAIGIMVTLNTGNDCLAVSSWDGQDVDPDTREAAYTYNKAYSLMKSRYIKLINAGIFE